VNFDFSSFWPWIAIFGGGSGRWVIGYMQRPDSEAFSFGKFFITIFNGGVAAFLALALEEQSGMVVEIDGWASLFAAAFGAMGAWLGKDLFDLVGSLKGKSLEQFLRKLFGVSTPAPAKTSK